MPERTSPAMAGSTVQRDPASLSPHEVPYRFQPAAIPTVALEGSGDLPTGLPLDPSRQPVVQLLDPEGCPVVDDDFTWDGDVSMAVAALRQLVLARRLDIEATLLQRQGELGLWTPMLGQEAVQIGLQHALVPADFIFPSYREHALATLRGVPVARLLGIFRGTEMGDWDAQDLGFANYCMVIGDQTLHATGYAIASALDWARDPAMPHGATVVFHGDGAMSEGDVSEAYLFAAARQAPIIFLCTNNQWAISEPNAVQTRVSPYQRAWGFGIPAVRVDGNDVLAMWAVSEWALARVRAGLGPVMIEAYTYRMGAHTTSDDPTKYRSQDLNDLWARHDPIKRLERWLRSLGAWDDAAAAALDQDAERLGAEVRQTCRALQPPAFDRIFEQVYAEPHSNLAREADSWRAYQAGFLEGSA